MRYAEMIMENWYLLVAAVVVAALAAAAAARFLEMPSAEQREKVKEWLRILTGRRICRSKRKV